MGREASATRGTLETYEKDLGAAAWVCPDLGRGFLGLPAYLLLVNLLFSVTEHPTHTADLADLAFVLLLASV